MDDVLDLEQRVEALAAEVKRLCAIEAAAREVDDLARLGRIATFGGDDTGALYRLRDALGETDRG